MRIRHRNRTSDAARESSVWSTGRWVDERCCGCGKEKKSREEKSCFGWEKKNFAGVWRIKQRGCSLLTEMSQITHKDGFGVFTVCAKLQEGKEKSEGEGKGKGRGKMRGYTSTKSTATMTSLREAVHIHYVHFTPGLLALNFLHSLSLCYSRARTI